MKDITESLCRQHLMLQQEKDINDRIYKFLDVISNVKKKTFMKCRHSSGRQHKKDEELLVCGALGD